jgi:hypothetical protein
MHVLPFTSVTLESTVSLTRQIVIAAASAQSATDEDNLHVRLAEAMENYPTGPMSVITLQAASGISDTTIYRALDQDDNDVPFNEETADAIEAALGRPRYSIFFVENRTESGKQPGPNASPSTAYLHILANEVRCGHCFLVTRPDADNNCIQCGDSLLPKSTAVPVG